MPELKKILLAEDDEFLASLLKNRFKREGFDLRVVRTGEEALASLTKDKPALLILDIILPGIIGFDIIEILKKEPNYTIPPFIVVSNLGQEEDIVRAKNLGAVAYFVKSRIVIDELVQKVTELIKTTP